MIRTSRARHTRLLPWLAAVTILLSLTSPMLSLAAQTPVAQNATPEYSVTIRNWLCESGVSFDNHDPEDLFANCATPFDGVRFRFHMFGVGETDAISHNGTVQFALPDPDEIWSVQ